MKKLPVSVITCFICFSLNAQIRKMPPMKQPEGFPDSLSSLIKGQFETGLDLYQSHCSKCHSPAGNQIPQFTDIQLMDYQLRSKKSHRASLTERQLSDGELGQVIFFLRHIAR